MTDIDLQRICQKTVEDLLPHKSLKVDAAFYATRSTSHKARLQNGILIIRIAEFLRVAPEMVLRAITAILVLKVFRQKVDRRLYRLYREYLAQNAHILPERKKRAPSPRYVSRGRYFELEQMFDQLNHQYFQNLLKKPTIGWSLNKSYRRLGFYAADKDLLVISRIFDSPRVPESVVRFLMYHEMLHIAIPTVTVNNRRRIHPKEFKIRERLFPEYESVQAWLKKNLRKL